MNIGTDQVLTEFNTYFAVYFNVSIFLHILTNFEVHVKHLKALVN